MKRDIEDLWNIGESQYGGHRLILRHNIGAQSMVGDGRYSFRVGIAIPFKSPQKDGMPGEDEIESMQHIEDMIYDYFHEGYKGVLCIIITTQGMKEFIIYSMTNDVAELITSLSQHFRLYDIQHYVEQDEEWNTYRQWDL